MSEENKFKKVDKQICKVWSQKNKNVGHEYQFMESHKFVSWKPLQKILQNPNAPT